VICGDLNVARTDRDVHPKERKPRAIGQLPEERALLEAIIGHGLVDVGRALDPDNDQMFTWWAPWREMRQRNIGWRLDYVLASQALFDRVGRSAVQREFGTSDHAPVLAEFHYTS
jgi:exodeoxyribonuclease-3